MIPFNKPHFDGRELTYIEQAIRTGKVSGDHVFSRRAQQYLEHKFGFKRALLTTSCTDALELAALLLDIKPGDEVILPSYTFVSTANAFVMRGASLKFADSSPEHPNIDPNEVARLITNRTRAVCVVHYAGMACEMDEISSIAAGYNAHVVEDAAQAISGTYKDRMLGGIGTFGTFSFHESKNITSGEGGAIIINDDRFLKRAEILREKGTNRTAFFRGEVDKYGWIDVGSSFLPSDVIGAYLLGQLELIDLIIGKRVELWNKYNELFTPLAEDGFFELPFIPKNSNNNAHIYYIVCKDRDIRDRLIRYLKECEISATFHYVPLHSSEFFKRKYEDKVLINCQKFADGLVRMPIYYDLSFDEIDYIVSKVKYFFEELSGS